MLGIDLKAFGFWAPAPTWLPDRDMPDQTGRVFIVTGANATIGLETARQLLLHNATVYAACRSRERAEAAIEQLKRETGKSDDSIHFLQVDLADIAGTTAAAEAFAASHDRLDGLINSAGVAYPPKELSQTKDEIEMVWGTNVVGHFALTRGLLPLLRQTAKREGPGAVRIVHVSSSMHFAAQDKRGVFYDGLRGEGLRKHKPKNGTILYGQSKLGNIHVSNKLAEMLRDEGIVCLSLHPGNIVTELLRYRSYFERVLLKLTILHPAPMGALTSLYAATASEITMEQTGAYLVPWGRLYHTSHPKAQDKEAIDKTWNFCEEAVQDVLTSKGQSQG